MLGLSIRQPFAELIPSTGSGQALRGIKTVEYRSRPCRMLAERFWIYASRQKAVGSRQQIWSYDLSNTGGSPVRQWMIELAEQVGMIEPGALLPTGVIVGSAVIEKVTETDEMYRWHLTDVRRARKLRKPTGHPQPVWFEPF